MGIILWLEEHRAVARFLAAAHMCAIFFFSSMSKPPQPIGAYDLSVLAHFLEYAILGLLLSAAFGIGKKNILLVILAASLYGVSDELHQLFVPGRVASIYDVATDMVGSAVGSFSALSLKRRL